MFFADCDRDASWVRTSLRWDWPEPIAKSTNRGVQNQQGRFLHRSDINSVKVVEVVSS